MKINHLLCILLLLPGMIAPVLAAGDEFDVPRAMELVKRFELKASAERPQWAERTDQPLFTVAWLSDSHILDAESLAVNQAACRLIREELHPCAVFVTGDNTAVSGGRIWERYCRREECTGMGAAERTQYFFSQFLKAELPGFSCFVIPGDNWYQGFEKVFGPSVYAFSICGYRFVFAAPDVTGRKNGCALMEEDTVRWIARQFDEYAASPVIYVQHEPLLPPSILRSGQISALFSRHGNVVGVLSGHLHLDLSLSGGKWRQWCAPSLGRSHRPGFKLLLFYPDAIIGHSYEWQAAAGTFSRVEKYQHIVIPEKLRRGDEESGRPAVAGYEAMPPRARREDLKLDEHYGDLIKELRLFAPRMLFINGE